MTDMLSMFLTCSSHCHLSQMQWWCQGSPRWGTTFPDRGVKLRMIDHELPYNSYRMIVQLKQCMLLMLYKPIITFTLRFTNVTCINYATVLPTRPGVSSPKGPGIILPGTGDLGMVGPQRDPGAELWWGSGGKAPRS